MEKTLILKQLGLTDNEVEVYLLLLRKEHSSVSDISKLTQVSRPHIYDTLNKLIERGLASYIIQNKKRYFLAANPDRLIELVKDKERDLLAIIPELLDERKPEKPKPLVEVYEGKEGLKTIFHEILQQKEEWLCWGGTGKIPQVLPDFITGWHTERVRLGITIRAIFNETPEGRKRGQQFIKMGLAESKYLKKEHVLPVSIYICGKKIMIIFISEEKPFVISIDDKEISDSFRDYFNLTWRISKK